MALVRAAKQLKQVLLLGRNSFLCVQQHSMYAAPSLCSISYTGLNSVRLLYNKAQDGDGNAVDIKDASKVPQTGFNGLLLNEQAKPTVDMRCGEDPSSLQVLDQSRDLVDLDYAVDMVLIRYNTGSTNSAKQLAQAILHQLLNDNLLEEASKFTKALMEGNPFIRLDVKFLYGLNNVMKTRNMNSAVEKHFTSFICFLLENRYSLSSSHHLQMLIMASRIGSHRLAQTSFNYLKACEEWELQEFDYRNLLQAYLKEAETSGEYSHWENVLKCIKDYIAQGFLPRKYELQPFLRYAVHCGRSDQARELVTSLVGVEEHRWLSYLDKEMARKCIHEGDINGASAIAENSDYPNQCKQFIYVEFNRLRLERSCKDTSGKLTSVTGKHSLESQPSSNTECEEYSALKHSVMNTRHMQNAFKKVVEIKDDLLLNFHPEKVAETLAHLHQTLYPYPHHVAGSITDHLLENNRFDEALCFAKALVEQDMPLSTDMPTKLLVNQRRRADRALFSFITSWEKKGYKLDMESHYRMLVLSADLGQGAATQKYFDELKSNPKYRTRGEIYTRLLKAYNKEAKQTRKYNNWELVLAHFNESISSGFEHPLSAIEFINYAVECDAVDIAVEALNNCRNKDDYFVNLQEALAQKQQRQQLPKLSLMHQKMHQHQKPTQQRKQPLLSWIPVIGIDLIKNPILSELAKKVSMLQKEGYLHTDELINDLLKEHLDRKGLKKGVLPLVEGLCEEGVAFSSQTQLDLLSHRGRALNMCVHASNLIR